MSMPISNRMGAVAPALVLALSLPGAILAQPPAAPQDKDDGYKRQYLEQAKLAADENRYIIAQPDQHPKLEKIEARREPDPTRVDLRLVTPEPNMEPRMAHCDQMQAAWEKLSAKGYCTPALAPPVARWWQRVCPNFHPPTSPASCKKPNLLLFLVDDMGWGDFGAYGGGRAVGAATPNVDRLAREGLLLTSTYSQPSCSPTRATIHTGQLPIHHGVLDPPMYGDPGGITAKSVPLPLLLKRQGYATRLVGKWHLGDNAENLPTALGYDEFYGFLNVSDMYSEWKDPYYNPEVTHDAERTHYMQNNKFNHYLVYSQAGPDTQKQGCTNVAEITTPRDAAVAGSNPDKGNGDPCSNTPDRKISIADLDQTWADYSVGFIHQMQGKTQPWFLYHATRGCHFDNYPAPEFLRMSYARTTYGDCTVEIDYTLGRLLKALKETGQDENTLVFFTSDNGPEQEIEGHAHTPFRGGKGDTWEGGMRVPGIVRWAGMVAAGRQSDGLFDLADLYPTFLALAGFDYASATESDRELAKRYLDAVDQTSFLIDDRGASNRRSELYWYLTTFAAVRMDEWKAHREVSVPVGLHEGNLGGFSGNNLPTSYLWVFNLQDDPKESKNVFIRHLWNQGLFTAEFKRYTCVLNHYPPNLPTKPAMEVFSKDKAWLLDLQAPEICPAPTRIPQL
jgi:arylsulfatase